MASYAMKETPGAREAGDMTDLQRRFVEEYVVDLNAKAAMGRASPECKWTGQNAARMLKSPAVVEAVRDAIQRRTERTEITQDYVLRELRNSYERFKDGSVSGHASAAVKCLELIGKHVGLFSERLDVHHTGEAVVTHIYLPDNGRLQQ